MILKKLINDLAEKIFDEACEWNRDYTYLTIRHDLPSGGSLDVTYYMEGTDRDKCEVTVYGEGIARYYDNLEAYLSEQLSYSLDWQAVEEAWRDDSMDEYQRNGFASEADFWRWKEG